MALQQILGRMAGAEKVRFTLKRTFHDGGTPVTITGKMDGFPAAFTADAVEELAGKTGMSVNVRVPVGASVGQGGGTFGPTAARQTVRDMATGE